jgi:hypothetical protein
MCAYFSHTAPIFNGKQTPEDGFVVGYAAIVSSLKLPVPITGPVSIVSRQNRREKTGEWNIFSKKYLPEDNSNISEIEALYKHLVFALKYEGVNLLVLSFLTRHYSKKQLTELISIEPTGQYSRRLWFFIEWLSGRELEIKNSMSKKSYVPAINPKHQYAVDGIKSPRHMVINNLPGTPEFCPLIRRTEKLDQFIIADYSKQKSKYLEGIHNDILQRTSAFLLLKDSKASFTIEGESPKSKRAARWGQAIGQAGFVDLTKEELIRLQQLVIENTRFLELGFRKNGGFVGEHDRFTGEPLPDHISAKCQDLDSLMQGLIKTTDILLKSKMDAVLCATVIAFGFVFIHPFEDGNGRIHRYLIHHLLAKKKFAQQGFIFPVSESILRRIDDYRNVLESYSRPLLDFIEWEETKDHNIEVRNDTIDYYRYFDASPQAEFLYDCVKETIEKIIPAELSYLRKYDEFKRFIDDEFEMPDKMVALLVRFLEQNDGKISIRAKEKEFPGLTEKEITKIEHVYREIYNSEN